MNEASSHVENELHRLMTMGDSACSIPLRSTGKAQRSGYPNLQINPRAQRPDHRSGSEMV